MKHTFIVALTLALPASAFAQAPESLRFLVCQPGGPELEVSEQAVIRDFYRYVGTKIGMKEEAITGAYFTKRADCVKALKEEPAVVMLSLDLFLELKQSLKLEPVAQANLNGETTTRFRLLAAEDGPKTLRELHGKPITGTMLDSPAFVARVLLEGKLGLPNELVLVPEKLGLRAVRNVIRGQAAAVIVDQTQWAAIADTPFAKKLRVLHESKPLPNAPVAVCADRVPKGLAAKLSEVMLAMTSDPGGQALIKTFGMKGFVKPAPGTWDALEKLLR